jgi:class 3 adenylate cyclase
MGQAVVGAVEYVTTEDGISIACQGIGVGRPILNIPAVGSSLRLFSELPHLLARGIEEVATVVRFDFRGVGMSDRSDTSFSLSGCVADAAAVAESLGPPVPVFAEEAGGPIALQLAFERPDLVSHLILSNTSPQGSAVLQTPTFRVSRAVIREDWDLWKLMIGRTFLNLEGDAIDAWCETMEEEVGEEAMRNRLDAIGSYDALAVLGDIAVPALIMENRPLEYLGEFSAASRVLSQRLRDSRLVRVPTTPELVEAVSEFLSGPAGESLSGAFRTVMFTDLVGSTALTQRLGDDGAQEVVETHDAAVRSSLTEHNGVEVKHTGDGIMAAFASATDAARAAQQVAIALTVNGVGVRIGLNAGEPIERDGDLFGTAVQLAARVGDAAETGQVLATQVVRDLTAGKGLNWSPAPAVAAKGFDDPISVFSLDHLD